MTTFRNYILFNFKLALPSGNIPASWFAKHGLPMIVACSNCGATMASPSAWVDRDGACYCETCAGVEED